ncbi:DNA methyltransferase [Qipengyuania sp. ASV99]|uniref:DNA methyltransferase n=1 Tax=Qipengyuania sp. ASV99 TaxID=3399681 RepID=UPI003A4C6EE5
MDHQMSVKALQHFDDLFAEESESDSHAGLIIDQIAAFDEFGAATVQQSVEDIPYFINEFWTSGQRKGHSIHEISYRACFKSQLPEFFIRRLTQPGDLVLDPFMGRGTTPVEAHLLGRVPVGNDINPLSVLLTRPRLNVPTYHEVQSALRGINWDRKVDVREDLLAFFHPETLRRLCVLREHLLELAPISQTQPDRAVDWVRMVAINRLTGHSAGFFSVYSLPPNQAVTVDRQIRINEKRNQVPPIRDIVSIILKKTRSLLRSGTPKIGSNENLFVGPADQLKSLASGSIALTITSPPFLDVVQYADDNWLRCWFAGIDSSTVQISMHRTEDAWEQMVRSVLTEQARVLRHGGHIAFEVGEVRNGKVLLEKAVWRAAEGLPFERLGVMVNQQEFTKTANCWGVGNNSKGTNTNRIVLLRRTCDR